MTNATTLPIPVHLLMTSSFWGCPESSLVIFMTPLSSGGYLTALTCVNMVPRTHPGSKAGEFAEGPNPPKKKHLLHRLVKKVLIHSRETVEIWYVLPNSQRFANCNIWLPKCNSMRTRPGRVEPEVYFRIVHAARGGHNDAPMAAYREQTVEIFLGPKGAFENGNTGTLTRSVPSNGAVIASLPPRGKPKPAKEPRTPRVVELLHKAIEWQTLLESGRTASQAEIARQEGITRARVTQVMGMLRLAPEIQEQILSMPNSVRRLAVTERALRPIENVKNHNDQLQEFLRLSL